MINARIKNKRDTEANWTATNPTLLNGEIIVIDSSDGTIKMKIGDGISSYSQLPYFADEILEEQVAELASVINECFLKTGGTISGDVTISGDTMTSGLFSNTEEMATDFTFDASKASSFTATITKNGNVKFVGVPEGKSACISVVMINAGNYYIYWPNSDTCRVRWASGKTPTLTADGIDILTFITMDGGIIWYGMTSIVNATNVDGSNLSSPN